MADCIFCKIAAGEIPVVKIFENDHVFAIDDINPVAKVHSLIITKKHYLDVMSLGADNADDADVSGVLLSIQQAVRALAEVKGVAAAGFRLITNCGADSRQSIPHLHYHMIGGQELSEKMV